jgi:hypothetical protein
LGGFAVKWPTSLALTSAAPASIPKRPLRLMLAGFLLGLVHDRRLMWEAQVDPAIRWVIGDTLHAALPDHASLTRIRQRWGEDVFRRVFTRVVRPRLSFGTVRRRDWFLPRPFPSTPA